MSDNIFYKSQNHHNFAFWKNSEEKQKELLAYTISVESRYHAFKQKEIKNDLPVITNYDRDEVKNSISSNISAVEGNEALVSARKTQDAQCKYNFLKANDMLDEKSAFLQYYYSDEEVFARKEGYNAQISVLEEKLKTADFSQKLKIRKQIKELKKKIKLEEANRKNYDAIQQLRRNPSKLSFVLTQVLTQVNVDFMTDPSMVVSKIVRSIEKYIEATKSDVTSGF
jgi:hypothetical protein